MTTAPCVHCEDNPGTLDHPDGTAAKVCQPCHDSITEGIEEVAARCRYFDTCRGYHGERSKLCRDCWLEGDGDQKYDRMRDDALTGDR